MPTGMNYGTGRAITFFTMGQLDSVSGVTLTDDTVVRDAMGCVHLMGEITTSATVAAGNHLARLPDGFRPASNVWVTVPVYLVTNSWATRQIVIDSDGWISPNQNTNGSFKVNGCVFSILDSIY